MVGSSNLSGRAIFHATRAFFGLGGRRQISTGQRLPVLSSGKNSVQVRGSTYRANDLDAGLPGEAPLGEDSIRHSTDGGEQVRTATLPETKSANVLLSWKPTIFTENF